LAYRLRACTSRGSLGVGRLHKSRIAERLGVGCLHKSRIADGGGGGCLHKSRIAGWACR
jgi:hypothetical protein